MARMVLLQHVLGNGSSHFDWLIEPVAAGPGSMHSRDTGGGGTNDGQDPDDKCLLAFRVMDRIDRPNLSAFAADMLPLHRRHYLTYQGPITSDPAKGSVKRVCSGMVRKVEIMGAEHDGIMDAISIRGKFNGTDGIEYTWAGIREGDIWSFKRSKPSLIQGGAAGKRSPMTDDTPSSYGEWELRNNMFNPFD